MDQQLAKPEFAEVPEPAAAETVAAEAPAGPPRHPAPPPPRPPAPGGAPRAAAAAPKAPAAPPGPVPEPVTGSKVVRDAVTGTREIGSANTEAARSARVAYSEATGGAPVFEPRVDAASEGRARFSRQPEFEEHLDEVPERTARTRSTIDYAKADARKAMKAKLIVGGIVGALFALAILIGFMHGDRILASFGVGSPAPRAVVQKSATPSNDRIAQDTQPQTSSPAPTTSTNVPAAAVAQRAVLYEENPAGGEEQLQTFVGTAVWRTETVNPGPGRPPELALRVDVEIPDRKMTVSLSMQRNPDQTLPASHTVEVQFQTPGDPFGGVANLPGIRAKTTETAQGAPLVGLVVRVMPGFFLVGLSNIDADREQNLSLLRERGWLDIPFVYNNGRRAVLVVEKGTPGDRAVNEAIVAWGG